MQYRNLGKTDIKVSEIGCGAGYFEDMTADVVDAVVNTAIDGGVNVFDVCTVHPDVRSNIGRALGGRRKDVVLKGHIGAVLQEDGQHVSSREPQLCDVYLKDFLTRHNTDYIDIGMIYIVDSEKDYTATFDSPFTEYIQRLKKDGVIRYIGASTHDPAMGIKMAESGLVDMLMFSLNPSFDLSYGIDLMEVVYDDKDVKLEKLQVDPQRIELYNLCAVRGVGITVMKALGAGRLLDAETSSLRHPLTLPQCVSYALDRPAVSSVILGVKNLEELNQALQYENTTQSERDYTSLLQSGLPLLGGKCLYCNHCLPCQKGINIASVTKYLDMAMVSKSDTIKIHYSALSAYAGSCVKCRMCEKSCPFGVGIVKNMEEAVRVFGK